MSILPSLNVGAAVTVEYQVLAVDQITGFTPIAGTVDILGNGTEAASCFKAFYWTSDCPVPPYNNAYNATQASTHGSTARMDHCKSIFHTR